MQDGNIHCHVDNLTRRNGNGDARIAVASAAYVSGRKLWSEVEQRTVDFDMREDVVYSEILLPRGAPSWAADREVLWNRVDLSARRVDARLAKTVVAAIARDIPASARVELVRAFVAPFVEHGSVVDAAIHEDGTDHNPHLHVLMTTRRLEGGGFGDKLTALEQIRFVKQTRKRWADLSNQFLEKAGAALRVDHRSYKARGIAAEPTVHRGPDERERRDKREHARRVREEQAMAKPEPQEIRDNPSSPSREIWPPEPVASPAVTPAARNEHPRAEDDLKLDQLETHYNAEPDGPWYDQALQRALAESEPEPASQLPDRSRLSQHREQGMDGYERSVQERAEAMKLSHAEAEAFDAVRDAPEKARRFMEAFVLQERMRAIREQDRAEQLRQLPESLRERLDALRDSHDQENAQRNHEPLFREAEEQTHHRPFPQDHGEPER
jgi:hypothetical protein